MVPLMVLLALHCATALWPAGRREEGSRDVEGNVGDQWRVGGGWEGESVAILFPMWGSVCSKTNGQNEGSL